MSILSDRLRELRGPSSQKEMADAAGIKLNAWARYERGEVAPGAEILANICRAHACSADWLLGLEQKEGASSSDGWMERATIAERKLDKVNKALALVLKGAAELQAAVK